MVSNKCIKGKQKPSTVTTVTPVMPSTPAATADSEKFQTYLGIEYDPSKSVKSKNTKLQPYKVELNFSGLIMSYKVMATTNSQAKDRAWTMYSEDLRKNSALPKANEFTSFKVISLAKKQ